MYRVSIELYKHEWKFGRTRNAMGTRAAGECFHSFFKFSQTFTSVFITRYKHGVHVFYFFQKTPRREKGKQLANFDYQNVNSLCSRHHYVNSEHAFLGLFSNGFCFTFLRFLVQSGVKPTNRDSPPPVFPHFTPITWLP